MISTLPELQVALAARRPDRPARAARPAVPVEHVVVRPGRRARSRPAAAEQPDGIRRRSPHGAHAEHSPPEAHQSSRIDPQLLGVLLFIISEAMLFGSFFTAYFFIRVVQNEPWPPEPFEFPVTVARMNTASCVSSSVTVHYALHSIKQGNRLGLQVGLAVTFLLGADVPRAPRSTSTSRPASRSRRRVRVGLLRPHRTARAHVFVGLTLLAIMNIRTLPRPLHARGPHGRRDAPGSTGTSST